MIDDEKIHTTFHSKPKEKKKKERNDVNSQEP